MYILFRKYHIFCHAAENAHNPCLHHPCKLNFRSGCMSALSLSFSLPHLLCFLIFSSLHLKISPSLLLFSSIHLYIYTSISIHLYQYIVNISISIYLYIEYVYIISLSIYLFLFSGSSGAPPRHAASPHRSQQRHLPRGHPRHAPGTAVAAGAAAAAGCHGSPGAKADHNGLRKTWVDGWFIWLVNGGFMISHG